MKQYEIDNLKDLIDILDKLSKLKSNLTLFRGQAGQFPLLPSISRKDHKFDTTDIERQMLEEFKRRTIEKDFLFGFQNEWDLLFYGQHYGLKTRLLDWSTNPLVSLWFALFGNENDSYLYILSLKKEDVFTDFNQNPFSLNEVKLVKPVFNNKRIVAQSGWFSIHNFNQLEERFVPLNDDDKFASRIIELKIPYSCSQVFINQLETLGINPEYIYQDVTGTCQYINFINNI